MGMPFLMHKLLIIFSRRCIFHRELYGSKANPFLFRSVFYWKQKQVLSINWSIMRYVIVGGVSGGATAARIRWNTEKAGNRKWLASMWFRKRLLLNFTIKLCILQLGFNVLGTIKWLKIGDMHNSLFIVLLTF